MLRGHHCLILKVLLIHLYLLSCLLIKDYDKLFLKGLLTPLGVAINYLYRPSMQGSSWLTLCQHTCSEKRPLLWDMYLVSPLCTSRNLLMFHLTDTSTLDTLTHCFNPAYLLKWSQLSVTIGCKFLGYSLQYQTAMVLPNTTILQQKKKLRTAQYVDVGDVF